jgi:hypothetical protein
MPEPSSSLEDRIKALETKGRNPGRFFVQYLLSPLLVVLAGFFFNWQLERSKRAIQQIEIAQSMLTTLFAEDEYKTLATKRLLDEVLEDPGLKEELGAIIGDYLENRLHRSLGEGNLESVERIIDAARSVGGETGVGLVRSVAEDPRAQQSLSQYRAAREAERSGFDALVRRDFEEARQHFARAFELYPTLHNVEEIHRLLEQNRSNLGSPQVQSRIYGRIVEDYSWKVPEQTLRALDQARTRRIP